MAISKLGTGVLQRVGRGRGLWRDGGDPGAGLRLAAAVVAMGGGAGTNLETLVVAVLQSSASGGIGLCRTILRSQRPID